jgi:hypothetical protein
LINFACASLSPLNFDAVSPSTQDHLRIHGIALEAVVLTRKRLRRIGIAAIAATGIKSGATATDSAARALGRAVLECLIHLPPPRLKAP